MNTGAASVRFEDVPVVVNAGAGSLQPGPLPSAVQQWVQDHAQREHVYLASGSQIGRVFERLSERRPVRVAVAGGDGTLSRSVAWFVKHGVEMVPLPLGTLNHFTRDLGIEQTPDRWVDLCCSPRVESVDVGEVAGHYFLNNVSVGLYPRMVRLRQRVADERLLGSKRLATAWASLRIAFGRDRSMRLSWHAVTPDGPSAGEVDAPAALISNNVYGDGLLNPGGRGRLDEGHLTLYVPEQVSSATLWSMAEAMFEGRLRDAPGLHVVDARTLELNFRRRRRSIAVDGELYRLHAPVRAQVQPQALRVVLPET